VSRHDLDVDWFCPLFAKEHRLAIFGNPVPSSREQLQCLFVGWPREHCCEASVIGSELSVLGNQLHGCHPRQASNAADDGIQGRVLRTIGCSLTDLNRGSDASDLAKAVAAAKSHQSPSGCRCTTRARLRIMKWSAVAPLFGKFITIGKKAEPSRRTKYNGGFPKY